VGREMRRNSEEKLGKWRNRIASFEQVSPLFLQVSLIFLQFLGSSRELWEFWGVFMTSKDFGKLLKSYEDF
jgi:hypothetical protein